jgi:hypothetical protein
MAGVGLALVVAVLTGCDDDDEQDQVADAAPASLNGRSYNLNLTTNTYLLRFTTANIYLLEAGGTTVEDGTYIPTRNGAVWTVRANPGPTPAYIIELGFTSANGGTVTTSGRLPANFTGNFTVAGAP